MSRNESMHYECQYCGHKQAQLIGSYLCPNCGHALDPITRHSHKNKRMSKGSRAVACCVLIIVIATAVVYSMRSFLPYASEFKLELPQITAESNSADNDAYSFSEVRSDLVRSEIDGRRQYRCTGSVTYNKVGVCTTTLTFTLYVDNREVYSTSERLGVTVPMKEYPFSFEVDLEQCNIEAVSPGSKIDCRVTAHGEVVR